MDGLQLEMKWAQISLSPGDFLLPTIQFSGHLILEFQ